MFSPGLPETIEDDQIISPASLYILAVCWLKSTSIYLAPQSLLPGPPYPFSEEEQGTEIVAVSPFGACALIALNRPSWSICQPILSPPLTVHVFP